MQMRIAPLCISWGVQNEIITASCLSLLQHNAWYSLCITCPEALDLNSENATSMTSWSCTDTCRAALWAGKHNEVFYTIMTNTWLTMSGRVQTAWRAQHKTLVFNLIILQPNPKINHILVCYSTCFFHRYYHYESIESICNGKTKFGRWLGDLSVHHIQAAMHCSFSGNSFNVLLLMWKYHPVWIKTPLLWHQRRSL